MIQTVILPLSHEKPEAQREKLSYPESAGSQWLSQDSTRSFQTPGPTLSPAVSSPHISKDKLPLLSYFDGPMTSHLSKLSLSAPGECVGLGWTSTPLCQGASFQHTDRVCATEAEWRPLLGHIPTQKRPEGTVWMTGF